MGSKTNTKSCHLFPQDIKLFPGFIICFMHKDSELPCYRKRFYSWLSAYSLALEELLLCKNYLRKGSSKAKQQKHPWLQNATKAGIWKTNIKTYQSNLSTKNQQHQQVRQMIFLKSPSLWHWLLRCYLKWISQVGLRVGRLRPARLTAALGFGECFTQMFEVTHLFTHAFQVNTNGITSTPNQFRWFSKQHVHTFLLFPWLYIYIVYVYSILLHQQNWSNASRRKSFTVFVFACLSFTKQKSEKLMCFRVW